MSDVDERFDAKWEPEPMSGCWLWIAAVRPKGYGVFNDHRGRVDAHRFSYEKHNGPIPEGLQIDHLCRVRSCVNPGHLEAVTSRENTIRGVGPQVRRERLAAITHCKRGHPLAAARRVMDRGRLARVCRVCARERMREWRAS